MCRFERAVDFVAFKQGVHVLDWARHRRGHLVVKTSILHAQCESMRGGQICRPSNI